MTKFSQLQICIIVLIISVIPFFGFSQIAKQSRLIVKAENRLKKLENLMPGWRYIGRIRFDSLSIRSEKKLIQVFFTNPLSYIPVRENEVAHVDNSVREALGRKFRNYTIEIYTDHHLLRELTHFPRD